MFGWRWSWVVFGARQKFSTLIVSINCKVRHQARDHVNRAHEAELPSSHYCGNVSRYHRVCMYLGRYQVLSDWPGSSSIARDVTP